MKGGDSVPSKTGKKRGLVRDLVRKQNEPSRLRSAVVKETKVLSEALVSLKDDLADIQKRITEVEGAIEQLRSAL